MSDPIHTTSFIPALVLNATSYLHTRQVVPFLSLVESAWYHFATRENETSLIKSLSITYFKAIQDFFIIVNSLSAAFLAAGLTRKIKKNYAFTSPLSNLIIAFPICFSIGLYSIYINKTKTDFMDKFQEAVKAMHLAKIILGIGSVYSSKNKVFHLLSISSSVYNYIQNSKFNSKLNWLSCSKDIKIDFSPELIKNFPSSLNLKYRMLAYTEVKFPIKDRCGICLDDQIVTEDSKPNPIVSICGQHIFHRSCLFDSLEHHKTTAAFDIKNVTAIAIKNYKDGIFKGTTYKCEVERAKKIEFCCAICRREPLASALSVSAPGYNIILNPRPLSKDQLNDLQAIFERVYGIYNVIQAGISHLQKYPELKEIAFKIRKFMLVTDILGAFGASYFISKKSEASLLLKSSVLIGVSLFSYFANLVLNQLSTSAFNLQSIVIKFQIPQGSLEKSRIKWVYPEIHHLIQTVTIFRILTTLGLTYFSAEKKWNLTSIASLSTSLFETSKLCWIQISGHLKQSFIKITSFKNVGNLCYTNKASATANVEVTADFMVDPSCTKNEYHLQSTLRSLYQSMSSFFEKSVWKKPKLIKAPNGVITPRYKIKIQNLPINPCVCTLKPLRTRFSIKSLTGENMVLN